MAKRWQPPPMNDQPRGEASPKVTVDEKVVRKMLQVNPELRDGRTTFQVKRDMEQGQVVRTDGRRSSGSVTSRNAPPGSPLASAPSGGTRQELDETLSFFIKSKRDALEKRLGELAAQRQALEQEEKTIRDSFAGDLAKFLAMLDPTIVAMHGVRALSAHQELLGLVGVTPSQLLETVRKRGT